MVWEWVGAYAQAFITLFIVLDPIGNVPLFHTFTSAFDEKRQRQIINSSVRVALLILVFFALGGSLLLNAFGISINDFRIAGGILLLIMSIEGLLGREEARWMSREDIAIVPLATPLMAGPGSIYTVVYLMQLPNGPLLTFFAIATNIVLAWLLLSNAERLLKKVGNTGSTIISRIMAFILSAIAINMIRQGLMGAFGWV